MSRSKLAVFAAAALTLGLAAGASHAKTNHPPRLPCGDYNGVPSHNDCVPISVDKKMQCQKWIDKSNSAANANKQSYYIRRYIECTGVK